MADVDGGVDVDTEETAASTGLAYDKYVTTVVKLLLLFRTHDDAHIHLRRDWRRDWSLQGCFR
jgi:hypothetical protein